MINFLACGLGLLALSAAMVAAAESAKPVATIRVRATTQRYKDAPVLVELGPEFVQTMDRSKAPVQFVLKAAEGEKPLDAQIVRQDQGALLVFVLPELEKGAEKVYHLESMPRPANSTPRVLARYDPATKSTEITVDGHLFTRYVTQSEANKPFFFPILTSDGQHYTRRYPMEKAPNESGDHIHHRGLWFTHGSVNGVDFWSETKEAGKTVTTGQTVLGSGSVCAEFATNTEWRALDGKVVATDTRQVRILPLPNGDMLLDFEIALKSASGQPLVFGDTKEGTFALRVAETLAPKPDKSTGITAPTGKMINDQGDKDGAAWGKKASWVDYVGPIGGKTFGIAMFDHSANVRHPQTWHARDYGLFAINPFGLHDFKLGGEGAGNLTVAPNDTLHLRYRLLFHKGDTETAHVVSQYAAYATPPEVTVTR